MAFTQDELQSFNSILDQKLSILRRDLERVFDQRLQTLRHEFEQRLTTLQQDLMRSFPQRLADQQSRLRDSIGQRLDAQHEQIAQTVEGKLEQSQQATQQQFEAIIERALSVQQAALEELMSQQALAHQAEASANQHVALAAPELEAIEVQAEIPWEDLSGAIDKALSERLFSLNEAMQAAFKDLESYFLTQFRNLRDDLTHRIAPSYGGSIHNLQDIFASIEQLERVIESMQVSMSANHALLSNRLYHHQQLPLERAHAGEHPSMPNTSHANGTNQLSLPKESDSEQ
ncbi:hypothetical protein EPA93_17935 [Ktedonosporobacter rubrisoli]|uniref:Uncharacterized protein n=1 Tax=Ktedonosporobacter rubrisoli TaxID=2509675 RepID=A0A4V0YYX8_KTERU|nr:hypothetical protein [Ktedonosporobacter rubrisoli]QBD77771.1 hypothetical protein EPA93_17935 [Ktedonosporobacter rubrisoli]